MRHVVSGDRRPLRLPLVSESQRAVVLAEKVEQLGFSDFGEGGARHNMLRSATTGANPQPRHGPRFAASISSAGSRVPRISGRRHNRRHQRAMRAGLIGRPKCACSEPKIAPPLAGR